MVEGRLPDGNHAVMATSAAPRRKALPGGVQRATCGIMARAAAESAHGRLVSHRRQMEERLPGRVEDLIPRQHRYDPVQLVQRLIVDADAPALAIERHLHPQPQPR